MRKIYTLLVLSLFTNFIFGQQKVRVHNAGNVMYAKDISAVDSIKFDNTYAKFKLSDATPTLDFQKTVVDSLTFTPDAVVLDKIYIIYNGTDNATIINPYANQGVTITATAGTVVVAATSGIANLEYNILGSSANGSLTMATDKDVNLVLRNVTLTNPAGAAFSISGGKITNILAVSGSANTLSDGSASSKNGTITTDGPIVINNSGALTVAGIKKHGINTSSTIIINSGTTTISSAASDGLHSEGYLMTGGTLNVPSSLGDGIDAGNGVITISGGTINITSTANDVKAIKGGTGVITITGGIINFTVSGAQSKGISGKANIVISGGTITATMSGIAVLAASGSGFDPSYCTAIKTDATIIVNGGTFNITLTAAANGGKAFSSGTGITVTDGNFTVNSAGTGAVYTNTAGVTDSYASSCFSTDADLNITGGTFNLTVSGTGGKGLSSDGNIVIGSATGAPTIGIANTGTQFLVTGTANSATADYASQKCIKADGDITINNGNVTLSVSNQNGTCIDADSTLIINGGTVSCTVGGNQSKGIKATGIITLGGGTVNVTATGGVVLETSGSGYDPSYCAGLKSDTSVNFSGANVTISGTGVGFKAVSSDGNINMTAGTVNITSSGSGTTYTGTTGAIDSYSSAAFSADGNISVLGGSLTTTSSGAGGKGLKADGAIIIGDANGGPTTNIRTTGARFLVSGTDYAHPKTIVAAGAITINNGTNTVNSTDDGIHSDLSVTVNGGNTTVNAISATQGMGEGVEAPTITFAGGVTNITASNDGINATYGTVAGGTESNDGSNLFITGGIVIVAGSDAIDSNGNITITGGTTIVNGPTSQPEEGIDFNGTFLMNGGYLISAGSNANMTKAMNTASTQVSMYIKSSAQLAATSLIHIENASGTEMVTFKPKNGVYYFHFSSPGLAQNTQYKIYFGGSYTGGSYVGGTTTWGLYQGGTYSTSGATLKSSPTTSGSAKVNTITF
ncbi:MAG: carbohydrate-binding domain-containing protein [Flavobacterium sp.]